MLSDLGTENIATITTLKAGEEAKRRLAGITKFQTLNIIEEVDTPTNTPTQTQICYRPPNNNTNPTKNKTSFNPNNNGQNKVTVLKRDPASNQKKENTSDIQCMLCNQPHATH